MLLNDVSWPAARRDQYYGPDRLPAGGASIRTRSSSARSSAGPSSAAARLPRQGAFAFALEEGGPRNGVLTAVEDFVATRASTRAARRRAGVRARRDPRPARTAGRARPGELLAPYAGSPFLARLERNRIELYLRVLELQDAAGHRPARPGSGSGPGWTRSAVRSPRGSSR